MSAPARAAAGPLPIPLLTLAHVAWLAVVFGTGLPRRHPALALAGTAALASLTLLAFQPPRP